MSKVRQTKQTVLLTDEESKEIFNNIFLHNEDSWHDIQDNMLLDLIINESRLSDQMKIKLLFKKYRDTARDLNLYSK